MSEVLDAKSIRSRLARGSLWISIGRVLTNGLNATSTIVLARLLAPTDFGLVALATSLLAVVAAVTELSMSQALVHTKDPTPDHFHTAFTLNVVRGLILCFCFAGAGPLTASLYHEPRLASIMYALGFSALLSGLSNPKLVVLTKDLKFHQTFIMNASSSLANVVSSVAVAAIYKSYWALIVGIIAGQLTSVILSHLVHPYRPALSWKRFRELWQFSLWLSLSQIANTLNYRFDQLLVGTFLGRRDLGFYTVGGRLAVLPGQEMVRPLTATLFPAFRLVADDRPRLRRAYERVQGLVTSIALPVSLGFGLIADPAVRLILGPKWLGAIPVVQLVAMLYSADTLGSLVVPLGMAVGETKTLFIRNLQKLAIRAPILVVGIYFGGLMGLLAARLVAGLVGVGVDLAMIKRLTGISILGQLRANTRCFVSSAAMVPIAIAIQSAFPNVMGLWPGILLLTAIIVSCAATYVGTSFLLWRFAGRPVGPEQEVLNAATSVVLRVKKMFAPATLPEGR